MTPEECDVLVGAFMGYQGLIKNGLVEGKEEFTKSQTMIVNLLMATDSLNMTTLSRMLAISKEQATRAVAPLVEQGLVARSRDTRDRKVVNVSLTSEGRELLIRKRLEYNALLAEQLSVLTDEEQAQLVEASRTAARLLQKVLKPPSPLSSLQNSS